MASAPMTVFPGDIGSNDDATLDRWHEIFQYPLRPGVLRSVAGDPFGSYTTECRIDAKATLHIDVNPGRVWAMGKVSVLSALATLAISANSSGSTRYDLVVARFNLQAHTAEILTIDGTPGGGPPTPTRSSTTLDVRLGVVEVVNGATATTDKVTNNPEMARPFGGARYGRVNSAGALQPGYEGLSPVATTKTGTGVFRFAPDIGWPDTDFTVSAGIEHASALIWRITAKNANYVEITVETTAGTPTDPTALHCTINHPRQNILGGT